MSILNKLLKADPLHIRDDDHPERSDISAEEFQQALNEMKIKFNLQEKTVQKTSPFTDGIIEAMNTFKK